MAYNAILGRPTIAKFMFGVDYAYQTMNILGHKGVISIRGDKCMALKCGTRSLKLVEKIPSYEVNLVEGEPKHSEPKVAPKPGDDVKTVRLDQASHLTTFRSC